MTMDQLEERPDQILAKIKETWGRLTSDDVALYAGRRDQFFAKLQEKYGVSREEAEDRLDEFQEASDYNKDRAA